MRGHTERARIPDEVARVIAAVGAQRGRPADAALQHRQRGLTLGVPVRLGQFDVNLQTVPVLGQDMAQIAEPRLLLFALAVQPRLGIGG